MRHPVLDEPAKQGVHANDEKQGRQEPETYAMLLSGMGLMGFLARRRKQQDAA